MRYEVLKDCYGFLNRYWEKGQIVSFGDNEVPPPHFKCLDSPLKMSEPQAQMPEDPIVNRPGRKPKSPV